MKKIELDILEEVKLLAKQAPKQAGVYQMFNADQKIIYIGKAKNIRTRLNQYITGTDTRSQIKYLMNKVARFEFILTDTEEQALILERDLIHKHKPRYNISLKDDKSYFSIRLDENAPWPKLELVRKVQQDGARYYGPFTYSYEVKHLFEVINKVVPLRTCSNTVFYNRVRPCLEYQIKRCCAPCVLKVEPQDYAIFIKQAKDILEGRTEELSEKLEKLMELASSQMRFEDAALYRDRVAALSIFKSSSKYLSSTLEDKDIFAMHRLDSLVVVSVINFRKGRIANNRNFSFSDIFINDDEFLQSVLELYYQEYQGSPSSMSMMSLPAEIIIPFEIINSELLSKILSTEEVKVSIVVPDSESLSDRLLKLAELNASQHFDTVFNAEERSDNLAKSLAKLFNLSQAPRRVECIDISNLQYSDIVGALVSFVDGEPDKNAYRKYKINLDNPNDFAAIYEVVSRRLTRGKEENDLPDLIVIDGGPPQLRFALKAKLDAAVEIDIVSIAKERLEKNVSSKKLSTKNISKISPQKTINAKYERVYLDPDSEGIQLDLNSQVGKFLVRLRDETHRFVITFHRGTRSKRYKASALDSILGLTAEMKTRLLKHYVSVEKIKSASIEEVATVGKMSKGLARKICEGK